MCKLNYRNRKSDGPKLGGIVAKDLRNQTKKCFAHAQPRPEQSPLVLELHGKNLTDEGCITMVPGLAESLKSRNGVSCNKLEELYLPGNELTTTALRALAEVIELSCFDLRHLDLSNNSITVDTDQQSQDWEFFLKSFTNCRVLRRLDFSGNQLGPRAFEVLARVYAKQPIVEPTDLEEYSEPASSTTSTESLVDVTNRTQAMSIKSPTDDPPSPNALNKATVLKRRQGLRSIPYFIFSDTGLNDHGALFLSYVIAIHYYPQYLLCPLRSASQAVQADEENHKQHCWGLVYMPNENLRDSGLKLLQHAEETRIEFTGIEHDIAEGNVASSMGSSFVTVTASRLGRRRSSGSEQDSAKKHAVSMSLDNYRHKVQRSVLEFPGYRSVELWRCALKMLAYARAVLITNGHDSFDKAPSKATVMHPAAQMMSTHAYVSRMMATSSDAPEPIFGVTGVSDDPVAPIINGSLPSSQAPGTSNIPIANANPPSLLQQQLITARTRALPDTIAAPAGFDADRSALGQLPQELWRGILTTAAGGDGILSMVQQEGVMQYALDSANRVFERGNLGKPESSQAWHILERMGCVGYVVRG